ncbi:MAG: hypothetical protein CVV48_12840, partial [Spirochaetae bacterium HGW-Spirochaetae-4]
MCQFFYYTNDAVQLPHVAQGGTHEETYIHPDNSGDRHSCGHVHRLCYYASGGTDCTGTGTGGSSCCGTRSGCRAGCGSSSRGRRTGCRDCGTGSSSD